MGGGVFVDPNSLMLQTSHPLFQKPGVPSLLPSLSPPESFHSSGVFAGTFTYLLLCSLIPLRRLSTP